jgi:hypothetical protein
MPALRNVACPSARPADSFPERVCDAGQDHDRIIEVIAMYERQARRWEMNKLLTLNLRRLILLRMCQLRLWKSEMGLFRTVEIRPTRMKWLHDWLLRNQPVDALKHAPCCPANHFHRKRVVFQPCSCGAILTEDGGRGMRLWLRKHWEVALIRLAIKILAGRNVARAMVVSRMDNNEMWSMAERLDAICDRMMGEYEYRH